MTENDTTPNPADLTDRVRAARRGLRRDVQQLVDALADAELLIPLARDIADAPEGELLELQGELKLVPHFLVDAEGNRFASLFTRAELLRPMEEQLGWTTDGESLKFCTLPASFALDMAVEVVDEKTVQGLVINAASDAELILRREELASIVARRALPLVGYVSEVPALDDEQTLIAEPGDPPPPELIQALEACLAEMPVISGYSLQRTFNPDRDLEPHLTLRLVSSAEPEELQALSRRVVGAIGELLPPPGYIDIVFDSAHAAE